MYFDRMISLLKTNYINNHFRFTSELGTENLRV